MISITAHLMQLCDDNEVVDRLIWAFPFPQEHKLNRLQYAAGFFCFNAVASHLRPSHLGHDVGALEYMI